MKLYQRNNILGDLGIAIGIGIIAGIAGTAAITLSQEIERRISNRKKDTTAAKAAEKVLEIIPASKDTEIKLADQIHWLYGSGLGVLRGLLSVAGLKGMPATATHFGIIWGTELALLPALNLAPPVTEQDPESIAVDAVHHIIYAVVTGVVYDMLKPEPLTPVSLIKSTHLHRLAEIFKH